MNFQIQPYAADHVAAVRLFNDRLTGAGITFQLAESPQPMAARREYLAIDPQGEVRGSFSLKRQKFRVNGETIEVGNCQLPISEGIYNPGYANLGAALLRH